MHPAYQEMREFPPHDKHDVNFITQNLFHISKEQFSVTRPTHSKLIWYGIYAAPAKVPPSLSLIPRIRDTSILIKVAEAAIETYFVKYGIS